MMQDHVVIAVALEAARLTREQLAALVDVPVSELEAVERGQPASASLLGRLARLLAVELSDLLAGRVGPAGVLYRQFEGSPGAVSTIADDGTALSVGGFVQDLTRTVRLEGKLGRRLPDVPAWATFRRIPDGSAPPHAADMLASEVRLHLGLGLGPVPSIWELARELGVQTSAVTPDELPVWIDGFSWREPSPGMVVNLVGGPQTWWRTRMTVAHELAHLLFDLPEMGWVLSAQRAVGPLYSVFEQIEQRANAFAAYLLAPPAGVRGLVGAADPRGVAAIREVSTHYGVGVETAVNLLINIFRLPRDARHQMLADASRAELAPPARHPDAVTPGLPRQQLENAVQRAVAAGVLDRVQARTLLGLHMSDRLPGVADEPLLTLMDRARAAAIRYLRETGRDDLAPAGVTVLPSGALSVGLVDAWDVNDGTIVETLVLTSELTVLSDAD